MLVFGKIAHAVNWWSFGDCCKISLLIISEFKRINYFCSPCNPQKTRDFFTISRIEVSCLDSLDIGSEIWWRFLGLAQKVSPSIDFFFHPGLQHADPRSEFIQLNQYYLSFRLSFPCVVSISQVFFSINLPPEAF